MANYDAVEQELIAFNNTNPTEANFESKCKHVTLRSTAAVHVAFDRPANTGDFLLETDTSIDIQSIEFTKVSALGNAGSGSLYILARR